MITHHPLKQNALKPGSDGPCSWLPGFLLNHGDFAETSSLNLPLLRAQAGVGVAGANIEKLHGRLHALLEREFAARSEGTARQRFRKIRRHSADCVELRSFSLQRGNRALQRTRVRMTR